MSNAKQNHPNQFLYVTKHQKWKELNIHENSKETRELSEKTACSTTLSAWKSYVPYPLPLSWFGTKLFKIQIKSI